MGVLEVKAAEAEAVIVAGVEAIGCYSLIVTDRDAFSLTLKGERHM